MTGIQRLSLLVVASIPMALTACDASDGAASVDAADTSTKDTGGGSATDPCAAFVGHTTVTCTDDEIVVESDGMPDHAMMVGIEVGGWNGQWPVAQAYTGSNAFRLPRDPTLKPEPEITIRNAVGVAVNGVPIFFPQSPGTAGSADCLDIEIPPGFMKDGECLRDPVAAGEMDDCGGHAGIGNDYHYHGPPTCLMETLDAGAIVGFMLDGFPVYAEQVAGSTPYAECGGYVAPDGSHYYATSESYPYISNCMIGEYGTQPNTPNAEVEPHPLPDAAITGYYVDAQGCHRFEFSNGDTWSSCEANP